MLLILVHNLDIRFIPDERGATLFITRIKYTELLMNIHEYKRRVHEWLISERSRARCDSLRILSAREFCGGLHLVLFSDSLVSQERFICICAVSSLLVLQNIQSVIRALCVFICVHCILMCASSSLWDDDEDDHVLVFFWTSWMCTSLNVWRWPMQTLQYLIFLMKRSSKIIFCIIFCQL